MPDTGNKRNSLLLEQSGIFKGLVSKAVFILNTDNVSPSRAANLALESIVIRSCASLSRFRLIYYPTLIKRRCFQNGFSLFRGSEFRYVMRLICIKIGKKAKKSYQLVGSRDHRVTNLVGDFPVIHLKK